MTRGSRSQSCLTRRQLETVTALSASLLSLRSSPPPEPSPLKPRPRTASTIKLIEEVMIWEEVIPYLPIEHRAVGKFSKATVIFIPSSTNTMVPSALLHSKAPTLPCDPGRALAFRGRPQLLAPQTSLRPFGFSFPCLPIPFLKTSPNLLDIFKPTWPEPLRSPKGDSQPARGSRPPTQLPLTHGSHPSRPESPSGF